MTLLGFDTATQSTTVGVRLDDGSTLTARDDPGAGQRPGHATRLLGMAADLLADAGTGWSSLGRIAVGVGPGTFTGLRVGIATARGLAQTLSLELAGVSSLQALAAAVPARAPSRGVLAVIDARRGEVFAAAYRPEQGGPPVELIAPHALDPLELDDLLARAEQASGLALGEDAEKPGAGWLAVGDGAVRYRAQLELAGAEVPADSSPLQLIDARAVCELGARSPSAPLEEILPDYRRRADAEIALESVAARGA